MEIRGNGVKEGGINDSNNRVVLVCCGLGSKENRVPLSNSDIENVCSGRLSVDTVNFDNSERVIFDVEVLGCEGSNVGQAEEVGSIRLDSDAGIHSIIEEP